MPSIAEATESHGPDGHRRLVAGLGLVLVGAVLVGLGAAGTTGGSAPTTGPVIGGFALLGCLWVVASRVPLRGLERGIAAAASVAAAASLLSLWALAPARAFTGSALTVGAGLGFAIGLTVLLAAVLAGMTLPGRGSANRSSSVAWTRSASQSDREARAADGGTAEDDLSFPLEDE